MQLYLRHTDLKSVSKKSWNGSDLISLLAQPEFFSSCVTENKQFMNYLVKHKILNI